MLIAAIDPGEVHNGVAVLSVRLPEDDGKYVYPDVCAPRSPELVADLDDWATHLDCSDSKRVHLVTAGELAAVPLYEWVERHAWQIQALVIERFQLYPWMARQQGFSEFGTAERIGVLKYLAHQASLYVVLQDAARNKKEGRKMAQGLGFEMVDRKLGSGRWQYFGPDFARVPSGHARDAAAHGFAYLTASHGAGTLA